ncbi:S8 family peptidase [Candidatus Poriferisodalis sp.]|uniref:S8 family peptidase n=1 Tax=Candidatus Poriferisodalis sp. TaxID=3101277 RepID=UPI003B013401
MRIGEGVDPRYVFKIRANSPLLDAQLRARQLEPLGESAGWVYVVLPLDDGDDLARVLEDYTQAALTADEGVAVPLQSLIDKIEDIEPYGREDRLTQEVAAVLQRGSGPHTVDVLVWPSAVISEARRRLEEVQVVAEQFGGTLRGRDEAPNTTAVRIVCSNEALNAVLELAVVASVRLPLAPTIEPSGWLSADLEDFARPVPLDAVVGVIDDGVATGHPMLDGLVVDQRAFPSDHDWGTISPHGTLVAGLAAYGGFESALSNDLRNGEARLHSPVRLVVARVLEPDDGTGPYGTRFPSDSPEHSTIDEAIRWMHEAHGVRIFNLSITDTKAFSGAHASLWTVTLDSLVRELDIVIVVAAGNRGIARTGELHDGGHVLHDYPHYLTSESHRLAEPATAANVITVGSLGASPAPSTPSGSSYIDEHAVAGLGRPSPFSRSGPGVVGKAKPDVAHLGGDIAYSSSSRAKPDDHGLGVVSLSHRPEQRLFRAASGTSFAAPRVANLAARLVARYPDSSANLLRALVGLSCDQPPRSKELFDSEEDLLATIGYGLPATERATDSDPQRVVMVHEGELECDSVVVHEFPVPSEFAIGASERSISIALAFDPPVRWQRCDYIAGLMEVGLYRNVEPSLLADQLSSRDAGDLPRDRRWRGYELRPTQTLTAGSTLVVRRWRMESARALNADDGDAYYVSVTHRTRSWTSGLTEAPRTQRYALAVELWDRERLTNLYQILQQQLQVRIRQQARNASI